MVCINYTRKRLLRDCQILNHTIGAGGLLPAPHLSDDRDSIGVLRYLFMVGGASTFERAFGNG